MISAPLLPAVDSHHHFWDPERGDYPWMTGPVLPIRRVFGPEDMAPLLAPAGVQKTVLVQTWSSLEESYEFLVLAEATDFVAGVVAWVDLTAPDVGRTLDDLLAARGANGWSGSAIRSMTRPIRVGWRGQMCAGACARLPRVDWSMIC